MVILRWTLQIYTSLKVLMALVSREATRSLLENLRASRPLNDPSSREKERGSLPEIPADDLKLRWNVVLRSYYVSCRPNEECDDASTVLENLDRSNPAVLISLAGSFIGHTRIDITREEAISAISRDGRHLVDFPLVPDKGRDRRLQLAWIREIAREFNTIDARAYSPLSGFKLFRPTWKSSKKEYKRVECPFLFSYPPLLIIIG